MLMKIGSQLVALLTWFLLGACLHQASAGVSAMGQWQEPTSASDSPLPEIHLMPPDVIGRGDPHPEVPARIVIRDSATLKLVWNRARASGQAPRVDFQTSQVVGILAGPIQTGGRLSVDTVGTVGKDIYLVVTVQNGCTPLNETDFPALLVRVPLGKVHLIERRPASGCAEVR
jgi:hypothetical protein